NTTCKGCHTMINPLGYLTENYDSLGRPRTEETRYTSSGSVAAKVAIETQATPAIFDGDQAVLQDSLDLGQYIAKSGKGQQCLVRQSFRYTYGRVEDEERDACGLENMRARLMGQTGGLLGMLKETTRQDLFTKRKVQ